jgi:hypothetical protein
VACGDTILVQGRALEAIRASDGKRVWRRPAPEAARAFAPAACRPRAGAIVLTSWGAALRATDGALLAEDMAGPTVCPPVVADAMAYFCGVDRRGGRPAITAVRLADNAGTALAVRESWTRSLDTGSPSAMLVEEGTVYLLGDGQTLRALDAASGAVLYAAPLAPADERQESAGHGSLARAGGAVYAANLGTRNRTVIVEHGREFRKVWEYAVAETPTGAPAFCGDRQYVCAGDKLYCMGGKTPREPRPPAAPAVAPDSGLAETDDPAVAKFEEDATPKTWVALGPFGPEVATSTVPGVVSNAVLKTGQTVEVQGVTRTAAALQAPAWFRHPKFTAGLQAVSVSDVFGRTTNATLFLSAVIEFDAPGHFQFRLFTPDGEIWNPTSRLTADVWLAGRAIEDGCVLKMGKGRYPLLIRARVGECEPHGRIWMAPRFADVTADTLRRQAEYERARARWPKYLAESAGLFVLGAR